MKLFTRWADMQKYILSGHKPKYLEDELIKKAKEFLPGRQFFWSGGVCTVEEPYGDYVWHFAVAMEQEKIWNYPEFQAGYHFGRNPAHTYRDANPYIETSRYRSWDCGYILGLHEKTDNKSPEPTIKAGSLPYRHQPTPHPSVVAQFNPL